MTTLQIAGASVAAVVLLWPQIRSSAVYAYSAIRGSAVSKASAGPSFNEAVAHLAHVRARLLATESLGNDQKKAIETLTLALVAGSDK